MNKYERLIDFINLSPPAVLPGWALIARHTRHIWWLPHYLTGISDTGEGESSLYLHRGFQEGVELFG